MGPESSGAGAPGWYGKLSALGDFASRRLSPQVQKTLDDWLSAAVAGSQQQLADEWLQRYLDSPVQRFVLGPGLVDAAGGPSWWFGALMPSCDKVGRYFPLVVLHPRTAPPVDRFALDHLELWWQRVGEAALETLSDDVDVEHFDRGLTELPPWPAARVAPGWAAMGFGAAHPGDAAAEVRLPPGCTPGELAQGLAVADWTQRLHGHSLWWSWRPSGGETTCRIVAGLPAAPVFAAMLGPLA